MFCCVHTNSIGSTQALLNAITENIYNHLVNCTLEYFGDKQTNQAASQLLFPPESFRPDLRGSIRCTSFPFHCIYFVKLNLLRLAPLKSWPDESSSCTPRGLKTQGWCGAQALRHAHAVYKKPPLVLCSWQVWGAQFISTLDKVPTGFHRANSFISSHHLCKQGFHRNASHWRSNSLGQHGEVKACCSAISKTYTQHQIVQSWSPVSSYCPHRPLPPESGRACCLFGVYLHYSSAEMYFQ